MTTAANAQPADALDPALGLVERYWRAYSTLAGAERALRRQDCKTIADLYGRHLAACAPALAQFGDIAVLQLGRGQHVAVCLGRRFRTRTEHGPADYGVGDCIAAFRTGAA